MFFFFSWPFFPVFFFYIYILSADFGDGTRGPIARPAAAAGGGVGAERAEGRRGADQPRGETRTRTRTGGGKTCNTSE